MKQPNASLGKDLVGLETLSAEQILTVLNTAEPFKEISERRIKKVPVLRGKTIVNLFFEASTRTLVSFEFAEKRLSADTVNISSSGSSVAKGEALVDTARNLEAMRIDMVVVRHGSSGAAKFLAERIPSNVIDAGDDIDERLALELRSIACYCTEVATEIVTQAFRYSGASSIFEKSEMQRYLRDINVAAQHLMVSEVTYELLGKIHLGYTDVAPMG